MTQKRNRSAVINVFSALSEIIAHEMEAIFIKR